MGTKTVYTCDRCAASVDVYDRRWVQLTSTDGHLGALLCPVCREAYEQFLATKPGVPVAKS